MQRDDTQVELLRLILENMLQPGRLEAHPWTDSLVVAQACEETPDLLTRSPGQRLVTAVARIFRQMMPPVPPKQGKRLDTRWGEFGILAALYFSPFLFGEAAPSSLRDAWGCIDKSILTFVFGEDVAPSESDRAAYELVAREPSIAPVSTLSDWHRNGLQRLLELILARESFLANAQSREPVIDRFVRTGEKENPAARSTRRKRGSRFWKIAGWSFLVLLLALIGAGTYLGLKARDLYRTALVLRQDAADVQAAASGSGSPLERLNAAGKLLPKVEQDYATLKTQVTPYLWLAPYLKWVPKYGPEIASAHQWIAVADPLLQAANSMYQTASPLLDDGGLDGLNVADISQFLLDAQPQLIQAHLLINQADTARQALPLETFSPQVRALVEKKFDPAVALLQDGFTLAQEIPNLAGLGDAGPQTYLLLAENEDELRPTGGFITAVGTALLQDGKIASMTFENSGDLDDWTKPYPTAPWQLQDYMNSPVLVLRDANWFTNYPTAARYAETLYSYIDARSEDGVIAFDQQALVQMLKITGPLSLEGVWYPIDSTNVVDYMRTAKIPTPEQWSSPEWNYKLFMKKIADAMEQRIFSGEVPLETLVPGIQTILNEHHVLIQVDNPYVAGLLAKYHWDGAVRYPGGDFLMTVDTNVGYNKTSALVKTSLDYDVDLTTPLLPQATLTVVHQNSAPEMICKQWDKIRSWDENQYPISDCYWNYMRVYVPQGSKMLDSTTQDVPGYWMIVKTDIPAHVDELDEGIRNIQAFGTMMVVPGSESLTTVMQYSLPATTIQQPGPNQFIYTLHLQKQPGTKAIPVVLRVHLPGSATIGQAPEGAVIQNNSLLIQTDLRVDRTIEIHFSLP